MLSELLIDLVVFLPILAATAFFTVSLVLFCKSKSQPELRRKRRITMIVSSCLFGFVLLVYAAFVILLALALRNM